MPPDWKHSSHSYWTKTGGYWGGRPWDEEEPHEEDSDEDQEEEEVDSEESSERLCMVVEPIESYHQSVFVVFWQVKKIHCPLVEGILDDSDFTFTSKEPISIYIYIHGHMSIVNLNNNSNINIYIYMYYHIYI